jgi:putative photosynthetic complex assembly protein
MSTGFIEARSAENRQPEFAAVERPVFTPRLIGFMGCLCLAAFAIAAFGRLTGIGVQHLPQAATLDVRELKFLDSGRGLIDIRDASDDALVQTVRPGDSGFIRTVMRGLAHERMARGGDSSTPFVLTLRADGYLILRDPMTKREVILDSFGKPNREVFAALLKNGGRAAASANATASAAGVAQTTGETK